MESSDKVQVIRDLHENLIAASESRLATIGNLSGALVAHVDEFRSFLEKKPRSETSRQTLLSGTITIDDEVYSVNQGFVDLTTEFSDMVGLDQLEAAEHIHHGQQEAETMDRTALACALIRFHEYRSFLAECTRLVLEMSNDDYIDHDLMLAMRQFTHLIFGTGATTSTDGSAFTRKCLASMTAIEAWLNRIAEEVQKWATLSQAVDPTKEEMMGLQQQNLTQQHESTSAILVHLVRGNCSGIAEFRGLLEQVSKIDKWNILAVHYASALIEFSRHFGSAESGQVSYDEAHALNDSILSAKEKSPWALRNFYAAVVTWWLAEYNSWYLDQNPPSNASAEELEQEANVRSKALTEAVKDGAFQCTLSMCSQIMPSDWYDPARVNLIRSLLTDAPPLPFEPASVNKFFQSILMESLTTFTEDFIANLPDTLRRFKADGDDQRKQIFAQLQPNEGGASYDRHLERFFVIMSYAWGNRLEDLDTFWGDTDGYMHGFLSWFSRKVSTPLMSAFCEMFRSISKGEDAANSAHNFLLEDTVVTSSKIRKAPSLSWSQMFATLELYASKVRDNPTTNQASATALNGKPKPVEIDEPETPILLECYLRLISHLCTESSVIRQWILTHPTFKLVDCLFLLCNNTVPSSIRSCTYTCLRSLLKDKSLEVNDNIWIALDQWVSNGFSAGSNIPRPAKVGGSSSSVWGEEITFEAISADYEEANSFTCLLQNLLSLPMDIDDLRDVLPFPEHLGSNYRMAGVEPYIDLAVGRIFASKVPQLDIPVKQHVLASNSLHLIQTCLETFNESLLVIGSRSAFPVDALIRTSSLPTYTRMHPFGRAIEWLFNEKVLTALFIIAHQDISEVNSARPDSPLVTCLSRAIKVMHLVMDLQSTYLDVVRPLIRSHSSNSRQAVINTSMVSFEDGLSTNLRMVVDLGYYAGSGHADLALSSLELLKKFSVSRKLNVAQISHFGGSVMINRIVGALQQNHDVDSIARSMSQAMSYDGNEIALGSLSSGFNIKFGILDFLEKTLSAHSDKPTMAHALLGFECSGSLIKADPDGLFTKKASLFHAILKLSLEYPSATEGTMQYWALTIKRKAYEIIRILWSSRLTSEITLAQLRLERILFLQWTSEGVVETDTPWDTVSLRHPNFLYTDGSKALSEYLNIRSAIYSYAAAALRRAVSEEVSLLKAQITSTLLGFTSSDDLERPNCSIFDLLDFMELDPQKLLPPNVNAPTGIEFGIANNRSEGEPPVFNMAIVEQLIALKRNELFKTGQLPDQATIDGADEEFNDTKAFFNGVNNETAFYEARLSALRSWVDAVTVLIQSSGIESEDRTALALQALQVICPKLEQFATSNTGEALVFAQLAQMLLSNLDFTSVALEAGRTGDVPNERLFQLFKISLRAISHTESSLPLRESLYNIAYRYLTAISDEPGASSRNANASLSSTTMSTYEPANTSPLYRHLSQTVKVAGDTLIDTISDDASGDDPSTRVAALLLLTALASLANNSDSKFLTEAFARSNYINVLTERLRSLPDETSNCPPNALPLLLNYHSASLALLLVLAQTRHGASLVLNAGLFSSISRSGLFLTDPDIGLDLEAPDAMARYFNLLLDVLRVVIAVVLTKGERNTQVRDAARNFLREGRLLMVGLMKRAGKIGERNGGGLRRSLRWADDAGKTKEEREVEWLLAELVEAYVLLVQLTGFLEFENDQDTQRQRTGLMWS